MVVPRFPQPDAYDNNEQILPHFSKTPRLTSIPRGHRYNQSDCQSIADNVRREVHSLYCKHNLCPCPRYGLYWAGSQAEVEDKDRDLFMVLVLELRGYDIEKWKEFDAEAREILRRYDLSGRHGVCVRYYQYWDQEGESGRGDATWRPFREERTQESREEAARLYQRMLREQSGMIDPERNSRDAETEGVGASSVWGPASDDLRPGTSGPSLSSTALRRSGSQHEFGRREGWMQNFRFDLDAAADPNERGSHGMLG